MVEYVVDSDMGTEKRLHRDNDEVQTPTYCFINNV